MEFFPNKIVKIYMVSIAALPLFGCSKSGDDDLESSFDDRVVIVDFADSVVAPTYQNLTVRVGALHTAASALKLPVVTTDLEGAKSAWRAARKPWEQSEAFLFGPVDSFGYDPALDSWPLNKSDLDAVLSGNDPITPDFVASLQETTKGFHAVEYLLFGEGNTKTAADFNARQLEYLTSLTGDLVAVATALSESWTKGSAEIGPYRDKFATAGEPGNTAYPSLSAAAQEIINGIVIITDEVANGKIADPFDARDPNLVESQYAYNSLEDFSNNIVGAQNAYLGSSEAAGTAGKGLTSFVSSRDSAVDTRIKKEFTDAIAALGAIPEPFRTSMLDDNNAAVILAAQEAIRKIQASFEKEVLPMVQD